MTIGAIVLDIFIFVGALSIVVYCFYESTSAGITSLLITIIIMSMIIGFEIWYFNNTASGNRALKTQESNFQNGISRIVRVYDIDGEIIEQYEGTFDITYDTSRILFDDENGKRHIIYYTTGTVIIDEK